MNNPPQPPNLTPTFCFSSSALTTFLNQSRSLLDDSISTNLNALSTPSTTTPFKPSTTTVRSPRPAQAQIPAASSTRFINEVLFPSWQARSDAIHYCATVATSPDPDDPEAIAREVYNQKGNERQVNERLDPYSGRFFPREARTERLAALLRNEEMVEGIVRERTWDGVKRRCEGIEDERWREGMVKWRLGQLGEKS